MPDKLVRYPVIHIPDPVKAFEANGVLDFFDDACYRGQSIAPVAHIAFSVFPHDLAPTLKEGYLRLFGEHPIFDFKSFGRPFGFFESSIRPESCVIFSSIPIPQMKYIAYTPSDFVSHDCASGVRCESLLCETFPHYTL
jgi:hypothetical protein